MVFSDFLMVCQIFLSRQAKQCLIITDQRYIYEFLNAIPKKLKSKFRNLPHLLTVFPIFLLRSKFGITRLSSLFLDVFQKDKINSSINMTDFNNWSCSKRKFYRQSFLSYFKLFWYFTKFSFHHNGDEARLLPINMVNTSCVTNCRKIYNVES